MTLSEWILNVGWRCFLPIMKMHYRIKYKCAFQRNSFFSYETIFEGNNSLGDSARIIGGFFGRGSYAADDVRLYNTHIGRYTSIGHRTATIVGRHPLNRNVSIHPAFYRTNGCNGLSFYKNDKFEEFTFVDKEKKVSVKIGNDVWIGSDVKIREGVEIGDGAVVAAGSLVTRNIPPYEIWMGAPAKKYTDRFDEEEKKKLIESKWWDWPVEKISDCSDRFVDIKDFLA